MTGSADLMEAHKGEEALPGSLSTGRAPALGLNTISAVGSSGLVDLIAQVAAGWEDSEYHSSLPCCITADCCEAHAIAFISIYLLCLPFCHIVKFWQSAAKRLYSASLCQRTLPSSCLLGHTYAQHSLHKQPYLGWCGWVRWSAHIDTRFCAYCQQRDSNSVALACNFFLISSCASEWEWEGQPLMLASL